MNRPAQILDLLRSLSAQTKRPYEIIIVDQSSDDATERVVTQFSGRLPLIYCRDSNRGLSRGRNRGLSLATGEIIAFPDDDCIYPSGVLDQVLNAFGSDVALGIYCGMSISPAGIPSQGRWATATQTINRFNIWTSQTSYTTFYRETILTRAGLFNEDLGVGSGTLWGAGEETELMLRALRQGAKGIYDPSLKIMHPEPLAVFDDTAIRRGRLYNRGFGRVLRLGGYPFWFVGYMSMRPAFGSLYALLKCRPSQAMYRFVAFRERVRGWLD